MRKGLLRADGPRRTWVAFGLLVIAVAMLAGCGGGSSSSSSSSGEGGGSGEGASSTEAGGTADAGAEVSAAEKKVEEAEAPIKFETPGPPIDMAKNKGKTVWFVGASLSIPFIQTVVSGFEEAAGAAGVNVQVFDGKGKADLFNQGVSTAVSQNADAIVLQAIDPALVSAPLEQAKAAGIPVIDLFNRGPNDPLPPTVSAQVTLNYEESGETMADYIVAKSGGEAKVGMITWSIYPTTKEVAQGFTQELKDACSSCSIESSSNVSPTAPANEVQNQTTTLVQRIPELNYLAPVSDNLATAMVPAVEAAEREGLKIVSTDGDVSNLEIVREGGVQEADVSDPPLESVGWSAMDQVGRIMAGMPASKQDADLPTRLFDTESIPASNNELFASYADYQEQLESLWGLSSK
jgi:ribose transport system substrate-binding protein